MVHRPFLTNLFLTYSRDKSEFTKKFKVEGFPTLILIRKNKYWKYHGDRTHTKVLEWLLSEQDPLLAKEYPEHLPGLTEEIMNTLEEIVTNVKLAYKQEPTKMTYFFVAIGGVLVLFLVCFIYAIYETCCEPEDEEEDDERKNK